MQIFAGSQSALLSKRIAAATQSSIGELETSLFPNREVRVWIKDQRVDESVCVVQSFAGDPNRAIVEFCLIVDALRRSGAKSITAVIPWLGYSIQDKIFRAGEPLSSKVVADMVQSVRPDKIITVDLHNEAIQGFFSVPIIHLTATPLFLSFLQDNNINTIVSPDLGALKESTKTAQALQLPVVVVNKQRDTTTGEISVVSIDGNVKGKTALITDDFISTGSTLAQAASVLKQNGVEKIIVAATHYLYVPGVSEKLADAGIDELLITDTIEPADEKPIAVHGMKTTVISVADLIAKYV